VTFDTSLTLLSAWSDRLPPSGADRRPGRQCALRHR